LQKLRKGLVTGIITPIFVEGEHKPAGALKRGLQIVDSLILDVKESPHFRLITNYDELLEAEKAGKISLLLGVEGGELIEDDLSLLRNFHRLGLRCFGFCWNQRNLMADGWDHYRDDRGLSEFGKQVVEELGNLRMIIDLAHMSRKGFWDVMDMAKDPLIVSHTCTSIDQTFRAMTNDQLKAVARNGGIIGIIAAQTQGRDPATGPITSVPDLQAYCDHVEHAVKVAGPDHVGLGPDFYDYYAEDEPDYVLVKGLEDHSKLGGVLSELSHRGLSEAEVKMIARDNFVRVLRQVVR
jgi:membrane dipeptidase